MDSATATVESNAILRSCKVEEIFNDFMARRAGLLKALTDDVVEFHKQCHPHQLNVRLYGLPNRTWELQVPDDDYSELFDIPAPTVGINFARPISMQNDRMWIRLVAIHSDSWLLAVAFYSAANCGFDPAQRDQLFNLINNVPTLSEIIVGRGASVLDNRASSGVTTEDGEVGLMEDDDVVCEEADEDGEIEEEYVCEACNNEEDHICEGCDKLFDISDHGL